MTEASSRIRVTLGDEKAEARDEEGSTFVVFGPWNKRRERTMLVLAGTVEARQQVVTAMARSLGLTLAEDPEGRPEEAREALCPECPHPVSKHVATARFVGCSVVGCQCLGQSLSEDP